MKCTELININSVILNNKSPLDIYIISKFLLYSNCFIDVESPNP